VTGAEFSGVDVDLLADYVGGALEGTPDEAAVAALIADDPAWREAHKLLSGGVVTVTSQLAEFGSAPEPMPADVIARLDAALLAVDAPADVIPIDRAFRDATAPRKETGTGDAGAAPATRLVAVPSEAPRKRARRLRWAAPIGIAAGVIAFIGFGAQGFTGGSDDTQTSSAGSAADEAAPRAAAGKDLAVPGVVAVLEATGTDYTLETLGQAGARAMAAPSLPEDAGSVRKSEPTAGVMSDTAAKDALSRLRVNEALLACINAIADESGLAPITAQSADFARYRGAPAVIVNFTSTGGTWVWAVGPECGTRGVGADKLGSVQVG
jgi:hypothetical protein